MTNNSITGNLVWIDLEMSGLNPQVDVILEISSLITDGDLNVIQEGPSLVINQPEEKLAGMDQWCQNHHGKSGLTQAVRDSRITLQEAQEQTFAFIKKNCQPGTGLLAGNSVWQDRIFLSRYMPNIVSYLHYRIIDVTSIKEVVIRWYPDDTMITYEKKDVHRAMSDVYESVAELKHYRKYFFV